MLSDTPVIPPTLNTESSVTALAATRHEQLGVLQESLEQHTGCCSCFAVIKEK